VASRPQNGTVCLMQELPGVRFLGRQRLLRCRLAPNFRDQHHGPAVRLRGRRERRARPCAAQTRDRTGYPHPRREYRRATERPEETSLPVADFERLDERGARSAVDADTPGPPMSPKDVCDRELHRGRVGGWFHHNDDVVAGNGARENLGKGTDLVLEPSPLHLRPTVPRPALCVTFRR